MAILKQSLMLQPNWLSCEAPTSDSRVLGQDAAYLLGVACHLGSRVLSSCWTKGLISWVFLLSGWFLYNVLRHVYGSKHLESLYPLSVRLVEYPDFLTPLWHLRAQFAGAGPFT